MSFYVNQLKYILSFELDKKRIYSETLTVYESIRPTKLYSRSYDPYTDSSVIEFGTNLKMAKKNQDTIAGNIINNCRVLFCKASKRCSCSWNAFVGICETSFG